MFGGQRAERPSGQAVRVRLRPRIVAMSAAACLAVAGCAERTTGLVTDADDRSVTFRVGTDGRTMWSDRSEHPGLEHLEPGDCVELRLAGESGRVVEASPQPCSAG